MSVPPTATWVCTLSTLRHFDSKHPRMVSLGPLIPWERRLPKMEIWEFQEVTFGPENGNRDYDRPFRQITVTLSRFD